MSILCLLDFYGYVQFISQFFKYFVQLGLNEADTLESTSILIYYPSEQSLYTQSDWHDAIVIKSNNKLQMK
jgi:hypothetical protein